MPRDCPLPSSSSDSRDGISATFLIPVILHAAKCFIGSNLPSAPPSGACPAVKASDCDPETRPSLPVPSLEGLPREAPVQAPRMEASKNCPLPWRTDDKGHKMQPLRAQTMEKIPICHKARGATGGLSTRLCDYLESCFPWFPGHVHKNLTLQASMVLRCIRSSMGLESVV